jgi:HD-GYP domain-containing protein (c-di-GMP phosphodiesterase class II)
MTKPVSFEALDPEAGTSLTDQMRWLHEQVRLHCPQVNRVAIALYDSRLEMLKTYVNSSDVPHPLSLYERPLSSVPSLEELARDRTARVINDMAQLPQPHAEHTQWLLAHGYRSSYTVPLFQSGTLLGFLFFDSREPDAFDGRVPDELQIYVQLCRLSVLNVVNLSHAVEGMVKVARGLAHLRDIETGHHLDRMSSYSRVVAKGVARRFGCSDEFIEHVYLFSPLHDIGKIGIADSILLKPGRLTDDERLAMQGHVELGGRLIDEVMEESGLISSPYLSVLHNLVLCHHEFLDGSGYPRGLSGDAVPLEARIVTIADIFDALTSERPYKKPWSHQEALAELRRMADAGKLDRHCVEAIAAADDEVRAIQARFGLTA